MIEIARRVHSDKPRTEVWARLADIENWHTWGPWKRTTVEGDVRTLVSERRRLNGRAYVMKERVTAMVPEERFEYDLLKGLPIKGYHSIVTLTDADGGGTDILWQSTFKPPWPFVGSLWRGAMLKVIGDVAEALAKA